MSQVSFQSKFCLPKRLPLFLSEYYEYLVSTQRVTTESVDSIQRVMSRYWPEYAALGKERKKRDKKEKDGDGTTAETADASGKAPAKERKEKSLQQFRDFVAEKVNDETLRRRIMEILNEYNRDI